MISGLYANVFRRSRIENGPLPNADVQHFRESERLKDASPAHDHAVFYVTIMLGMGIICAGSAVIVFALL